MSSVIMDFFHNDYGNNGSGEDDGYGPGIINPATLVNSDYKYKIVADSSNSTKVRDVARNTTYTGSSYISNTGALGKTGRVVSVLNYGNFNVIKTEWLTAHSDPEFTVSFWVLTSAHSTNEQMACVWGGKRFYIVLYAIRNTLYSYDYPYIIDTSEQTYIGNLYSNTHLYLKNPNYKGVKKNAWNYVALTKKDGIGRLWINGDFQGKFNFPTYVLGDSTSSYTGLNPLCGGWNINQGADNARVYFDDYCVLNKALYTVDQNIPVPTEYFPWN